LENKGLIASCAKGDPNAQRKIYEDIGPKIMGTCIRYSVNREDAEEIFHDAMLKVFLNIGKFNGKSTLLTWANRIAINTAIDFIRKHKSQIILEHISHELHDNIEDNAFEGYELKGETALNMIKQLSPSHQILINLFIIDGYSHKDISQKLNISEEASRSMLSRAKRVLTKLTLTALKSNEKFRSIK
jgi:RNA polymerase sigma-70 factor (ECF subfamily)